MLLNAIRFARRLWQLGYFNDLFPNGNFDPSAITPDMVVRALEAFCEMHGIDPDNDRMVEAMLTTRHRCALPDIMQARDSVCKWPHLNVTWYVNVSLGTLSTTQVMEAFRTAYQQWADICGIQPVYGGSNANVNIYSQAGRGRKSQLDGPGGTLAWSELPCGASKTTRLQQMYDGDENWDFDMLVAVACHEIGHALGLSHGPRGALMAAYYDPKITKPQSWDIQQMVALYGRSNGPTNPGGPGGTPTTPSSDIILPGGRVSIAGVLYELKRVA